MALKDMNITVDGQRYDIPIDTKQKQINAPGRYPATVSQTMYMQWCYN